jgi:signal transduction histidine kinase/HAMP domain-containing protein/ActR/RegA family two-component response regulator
MKLRILLAFLVLFGAFALGGVVALVQMGRTGDELQRLIQLHKIENLRRDLVIDVHSVQGDLFTVRTPMARNLDAIVENALHLEAAAKNCSACHHPLELSAAFAEIEVLIRDYQTALSYYITARANQERLERFQLEAAALGDRILMRAEQMSVQASQRLEALTRAASERLEHVRLVLILTAVTTFFVALLAALHLARSVTRPVARLLDATRSIAGGDLGRTVTWDDGTEFSELAHNFNRMTISLRDGYEQLRTANEELRSEVAERRRAEEALRRDEARLQALLELARMPRASTAEVADFTLDRALRLTESAVGFVALSEDGRFFSRQALRTAAGDPCAVLGDGADHAPIDRAGLWAEAVRTRQPVIRNETTRAMPSLPAGHPRLGRLLVVPLVEDDRVLGVVAVANREEDYGRPDARQLELLLHGLWEHVQRRKGETALQRAQKLESVGLLAGGIAHDFNNLLTGVLANVSLAQSFADPDDRVAQRLLEVEKATVRAQGLTQQLLTFSKGGRPIKRVLGVGELVREAAVFALTGTKAVCDFRIAEDLRTAAIDPGQMAQVVSNMVINAEQAMPRGGTVAVSCENAEVSEGSGLPLAPGPYVRITVEDRGCGIAEENLPQIFDPYFTTKAGGSGLGLTVSYAVVKQHDGHIHVKSTPGQGSVFSVYLPADGGPSEETEAAGGPSPGTAVRCNGRKCRILLMDDEAMIRDVAGELLLLQGFGALTVADGGAAVEAYVKAREEGEPFDLVILDLTVPGGMGGLEAVRRIREIDPEARAIVSSGYSGDPVMAEYARYGFRGRIAKPYRMSEFLRTLHEVLEGPA